MEKYGVVIDPEKVEKEKRAGKGDTKVNNPNSNIPLDPEKGSEPYEKEPKELKDMAAITRDNYFLGVDYANKKEG